MHAWSKLLNHVMIVGVLLSATSLFPTSNSSAGNVDNLNPTSADRETTDNEITIALINSLATEKAEGHLKGGFDIDLQVTDGTVGLSGSVTTNEQLKLLLQTAKSTQGVNGIVNRVSIKSPKTANPPVEHSGILRELAEARKLIRQLDERLEKLEAEVSTRRKDAQRWPAWPKWPSYSRGYPDYAKPNYAYPPYTR